MTNEKRINFGLDQKTSLGKLTMIQEVNNMSYFGKEF